MKDRGRTFLARGPLMAALALAAGVAMSAGTASAKYMSDGAVQQGTTGGWIVPSDGVCVLGVDTAGNMTIDGTITTRRDCDARLITGLTGSCTDPALSGDSQAHAKAGSSTCVTVDGLKQITGTISLKDLDRTAAICQAKGGFLANNATYVDQTQFASGKGCVAHSWQFRGQDADGNPLAFGAQGTAYSAGATGFCSAYMDTGLGAAACPSTPGSGSGTQTATSSAAFGYVINGALCDYQFGVNGPVDQNKTRTGWVNYTSISGVAVTPGTPVDLTTASYDTMGECIAAGFTWVNWIPEGPGSARGAIGTITTAVTFNLQNQAVDADEGCLHCHSTNGAQYNGPSERWKDSYLETGHKNMLRKVTAGKAWAGPDANGNIVKYTAWGTGGANTIDWALGTTTMGGTSPTYNLLYIFGDWMAPAPEGLDVVVDVAGAAKYNATSTYSCAACHSTGWHNPSGTAGVCSDSSKTTSGACLSPAVWYPSSGVQAIGTAGYAGQQPPAGTPAGITGKWDLDGITCARCHNATVPSVTAAQIAASVWTTTQPTGGGMGALAATNALRTSLCYGCHQSPAKDTNGVGLAVDLAHPENIPVKNSVTTGACAPDTTKTSESSCQAVASIWTPTSYVPMFSGHVLGNSFLNSVHGRATGTIQPNSLGKYDIASATYTSTFKGYMCYQGTTTASPAKTKADGTEIKTKAECEALYPVGSWRADNGVVGNGTQGTCVTCHDVHQSLFVTGHEALRKECTSCHDNAVYAAAVPTAPQIDLTKINHLGGIGTPLEHMGTEPDLACEICHMPKPTSGDFPMHVWRINPADTYSTFPTAAEYGAGTTPTKKIANASDDNGYAPAVWVDVDLACGQCHGGSAGAGATKNGAIYRTKATLAAVAQGIHTSAGLNCQVTFSTSKADLAVTADADVNCGTSPPALTYDWTWGDGNSDLASTDPKSHTYALPGTYTITLDVKTGGLSVGTLSRTVTLTAADLAPVATANCSWNANTWTLVVTDTSTDSDATGVMQVIVDWNDGTSKSFPGPLGTATHVYAKTGTFTPTVKAIDSAFKWNVYSCAAVSPAAFTISGTVFEKDGTTPLSGALVTVKKGASAVKTVSTLVNGTYSIGGLKPATNYTLVVSKSLRTFPASVGPITIGPDATGQNVTALTGP